MATIAQWIEGARPRTLPAAIAPVIVGTAAAYPLHRANLGLGFLALLLALAIQVGVNYANDYSDGKRGTDKERIGPVRLVGQGLANPGNVKLAALGSFGAAALIGLALVSLANTPLLLPVGMAAIAAAWFYTGGTNPYGYRGLGELFVFIFFGLVATLGTLYAMAHQVTWVGLIGAASMGCIASAILVANNLRDIPTDTVTGKRTLAVRLGDRGTRTFYVLLIGLSLAGLGGIAFWHLWALLGLLALPLAVRAIKTVVGGATGPALIPVLFSTGLFEVAYAVLLAAGIVISAR